MSEESKAPQESEKPQLKLEDHFTFTCNKSLECYTSCCRDVNIFLTPHDVIRLKKAMGITSTEFLEQYTDIVVVSGKHLPLVQLRMDENNDKRCFFVRPNGCLYYPHRPWACRMFPLDENQQGGFTITASPERCHGLVKGTDWEVREWLKDQGATQSKEMDGSYDSLSAHEFLRELDIENEEILNMVVKALWDVDGFRQMVLKSSFLDKFELEPERIDVIKYDDLAMMDLGYDWVRFGLFGQKTLKVKEGQKPRPGVEDEFKARIREAKAKALKGGKKGKK